MYFCSAASDALCHFHVPIAILATLHILPLPLAVLAVIICDRRRLDPKGV